MKIFKIKFDSKDPTDRSISVKKGDDFGIAIQIDNQASQGPTTITYGGQTISADTELVAGYNTFLLKGLADEKISVKDIDSQVIFTLNILAKDSDVVELGGTGSGSGESVWQADEFDYYIDGALSVNNCQKVTITGNNDQVILKGLCDDASYEIENGNLILNTPKGIQINGTCYNDTPYIGNVNDCGRKTSFIEFERSHLNLAYDSGSCSKNAININGCGICIDAQYGKLYLKSSDTLNICAGNNVCIDAGSVSINSNSQVAIYANGYKALDMNDCGGVNKILFYSPDGPLKTDVKDITLSATNATNITSRSVNITSKNVISAHGQAVKLETLSSASYIMVGLPGCESSSAEKYIGIKSDWIETCAGEKYSTFICGKQVIDSTYNYNTMVNQFGNCEMATDMFGRSYRLYSSTVGMIIDASNNDKVIFGASLKDNNIVGHYITLSATDYCGAGAININGATNISGSIKFDAQPCGGCATAVYLNGAYCAAANDYNVKFVLPNNLEFYGTCTCEAMPHNFYGRSKVLLTLISALETTYHNSCSADDTKYSFTDVDRVVYNKLTSIFAIP